MYGECELANESCKYFVRPPLPRANLENGCYSDENHIVPQRLAHSALTTIYIYSPDNREQICRAEHDEINRLGADKPLPDRETMLESLRSQLARGVLKVSSATTYRIIEGTL